VINQQKQAKNHMQFKLCVICMAHLIGILIGCTYY